MDDRESRRDAHELEIAAGRLVRAASHGLERLGADARARRGLGLRPTRLAAYCTSISLANEIVVRGRQAAERGRLTPENVNRETGNESTRRH